MPSFVHVMFSFSLQIWNTFGIRWNKLFRAKTSHQCISAAAAILDFFDNKGQIFDSLVHPLKLVQIKNPFGILQTNPQIPQKWVGLFYFQKNMFCWDTLMNIGNVTLGRRIIKPTLWDHTMDTMKGCCTLKANIAICLFQLCSSDLNNIRYV